MAETTHPIQQTVTRTPPSWRLSLLGAWQLSGADQPIDVGTNGQRLFAILALRGRCDRSYLSGVLWPDCSEPHAHGNLRATLSRLHRRRLTDPLESSNGALRLRSGRAGRRRRPGRDRQRGAGRCWHSCAGPPPAPRARRRRPAGRLVRRLGAAGAGAAAPAAAARAGGAVRPAARGRQRAGRGGGGARRGGRRAAAGERAPGGDPGPPGRGQPGGGAAPARPAAGDAPAGARRSEPSRLVTDLFR